MKFKKIIIHISEYLATKIETGATSPIIIVDLSKIYCYSFNNDQINTKKLKYWGGDSPLEDIPHLGSGRNQASANNDVHSDKTNSRINTSTDVSSGSGSL